jgi:hypothetical protein
MFAVRDETKLTADDVVEVRMDPSSIIPVLAGRTSGVGRLRGWNHGMAMR